jgi:aspartyl/asparaginyl beta-hydroxylase (cupin superfamily)
VRLEPPTHIENAQVIDNTGRLKPPKPMKTPNVDTRWIRSGLEQLLRVPKDFFKKFGQVNTPPKIPGGFPTWGMKKRLHPEGGCTVSAC